MASARAILKRAQPLTEHASAVLRCYARLIFSTNPLCGALLLLATLAHAPQGVLGILAVLTAQALAGAAGYSREARASGYYGYNALLVGLALAESQPFGLRIALIVVAGAALAAVLTPVLGDLLYRLGLPLVALPFVLVASLTWHTTLAAGAQPFWLAPELPAVESVALGDTLLRALGAIVFAPSRLGGALVLCAALLHSRIGSAALLLGALVGATTARALGVSDTALLVPAAYNAALTFAALGAALYVPAPAALGVAAVAAAATAWLSLAFMLPFAPLAVPVLAWPFVVVTLSVMRALGLRSPGRRPYLALLPHATPEHNLEYARTFAKRLQLPGPPRFVLPVNGTWCVTQGVDGPHTHRGAWRHALDFEIVDADGFPFRGEGTALSDYYCFGEPVLAPGTGVVVAVHDGLPDNPPGQQDLAHPWGNAIVVQHGVSLFSVVAHLKLGSSRVVVGQQVNAGDAIAQCGSSGRSPRPHVHFQAQASAAVGAPTAEFQLVQYTVQQDVTRFHRIGVPKEGDLVQSPGLQPLLAGDRNALLRPDQPLVDASGRALRLRREVTLLGENVLTAVNGAERLYCVPHAGGVLFTALNGPADGALGAILQIAPNLPAVDLPRIGFDEELSPEPLLPLPLRLLYQVLAVFVESASARVSGVVTRQGDRVVVESECRVEFCGQVVRSRRGRIVLDGEGIASIELASTRRTDKCLFRAARPPQRRATELEARHQEGVPACIVHH